MVKGTGQSRKTPVFRQFDASRTTFSHKINEDFCDPKAGKMWQIAVWYGGHPKQTFDIFIRKDLRMVNCGIIPLILYFTDYEYPCGNCFLQMYTHKKAFKNNLFYFKDTFRIKKSNLM